MTRFSSGLQAFYDELRRRHVFRAAAGYGVGAFVVLQAADLIFQGLPVPEWVYPMLTVLCLVGFPIVLVLAWVFQWTSQGIRREDETASPGDAVLPPAAAAAAGGARANVRAFAYVGLGIVIALVGTGLSLPLMYSDPDLGAEYDIDDIDGIELVSNDDDDEATTLAVLPFISLTGADDAGFADGLAEDITATLAQLGGVDVVSRTTSEAYRGSDKTARVIGEELDVGLILEGTIRRAGDRVRVTVQLIDANADRHLWANSYDRDLTGDVFGTQSELAQEIVAAIQSVVDPAKTDDAERRLLAGRMADAGGELLERADPNVDAEAEELFHQALQVDRQNPVAHAGIAQTLVTRTAHGGPPALLDSALAHAELAIRLDPQLADAYAAQAFVLLVKGEMDSARVALRHAFALDETGERFEVEWQERIRMISPEALEAAEGVMVEVGDGTTFRVRETPPAPRVPAVRGSASSGAGGGAHVSPQAP